MSEFDHWGKSLPSKPIVNRDEFILERCAGRSVAHLGACDSPMTRDKAEKGTLLHQALRRRARSVTGYDHDGPSIRLLAAEFGIDDILELDLAAEGPRAMQPSEVVVCADIIEHVNSVGNLLLVCDELLEEGGEVVISTINALSMKQSMRAALRREPVHPDHIAYFSFGTLGALLGRFGFELIDFRTFAYPTVSKRSGIFFGGVYRLFPQCADGIIAVARKVESPLGSGAQP